MSEGKNAFDALEGIQLQNRIKKLEYDCAELTKQNEELRERCKLLASRQPEWPKGYRPVRKNNQNNQKRYNERRTH
jgi:hypothetical protein|tara:strand:+ start:98 stop:325 length:228 start_codon:yes stop_codon:yes gene_type:complete